MTVVELGPDWFAVDISQESVSRTASGRWEVGGRLNLERSLKLGDELGVHIVTGHVDGIAEVIGLCPEGGSSRVGLRAPDGLGLYLAPKGSITLDGVSLTVTGVGDDGPAVGPGGLDLAAERSWLEVGLIPTTLTATTLGARAVGDAVNLEVDVLAKHVERLLTGPGAVAR